MGTVSEYSWTISHCWDCLQNTNQFHLLPQPGFNARLFLAAYNYKLEYCAGSLNGNADCLSCLPLGAQEQDVAPSTNRVHMMNLVDAPMTVAAVRSEMKRDPILSWVYDYTMKGWCSYASIETLKPYFSK